MFRNYYRIPKGIGGNIKHYFFEFALLFLAIFLGFLTENYRDQRVKEDQVRQYLGGIIQDVRLDQKLSQKVITDYEMRVGKINELVDSFYFVMNGNYLQFERYSNYYFAYEDFYPTVSSYRQLQSGGFSLIRDISLLDSINSYYQQISDVMSEVDNMNGHFHKLWDSRKDVVNLYKLHYMTTIEKRGPSEISMKEVIFEGSEKAISKFYANLRTVRSNLHAHIKFHRSQVKKGDILIEFIEQKLEDY